MYIIVYAQKITINLKVGNPSEGTLQFLGIKRKEKMLSVFY